MISRFGSKGIRPWSEITTGSQSPVVVEGRVQTIEVSDEKVTSHSVLAN